MTTTTTTATATVPTASELREQLEAAGLHGPALDWAVKAHGPARHKARTEAAKAAALAEARRIAPDISPMQERALALLLIWAELVGEGGRAGLGGPDAGTARLPWAQRLGKGRRLASDGPAWDAAVAAAGDRLAEDLRSGRPGQTIEVTPSSDGRRLSISIANRAEEAPSVPMFEVEVYPPRAGGLIERLARRALAPAVGLADQLPAAPQFDVDVTVSGDAAAWSAAWAEAARPPYQVGADWEAKQNALGIDVGSGDDPEGAAIARKRGVALGYEGEELELFVSGATAQYRAECASTKIVTRQP
jgi:hypothetical protein